MNTVAHVNLLVAKIRVILQTGKPTSDYVKMTTSAPPSSPVGGVVG